MNLSFINPNIDKLVEANSLEQFVDELVQIQLKHPQSPNAIHIKFTQENFTMDLEALKQLTFAIEDEKLTNHFSFECKVHLASFSEEVCKYLKRMNIIRVNVPFYQNTDFKTHEQIMAHCRKYQFHVNGQFKQSEEFALSELVERYWFMFHQSGHLDLELLDERDTDWVHFKYNELKNWHSFYRQTTSAEQEFHQQGYQFVYNWLRMNMSQNVKNILEINPFSSQEFYQQKVSEEQQWNITSLPLSNYEIPVNELNALNKTYDAIILYQSLPSLKDPYKDLLLLQSYARLSTQWIFVNYNFGSLPMLYQLVNGDFQNSAPGAPMFNWVKFYSESSLKQLYDFLGLDVEIFPMRFPLDQGYQDFKQLIWPNLKEEYPELDTFESSADVQAYLCIGSTRTEVEEEIEAGFISGGFLD